MEFSKKSIIFKLTAFYHSNIIDFLILCLLLFALWFIIEKKYFSYVITIIFAICGVIFYIVLKKYYLSDPNDFGTFSLKIKHQRTLRMSTTIVFFIFFCVGLLSLLQGFYSKNVYYYFSVAVCAGMVLLDIFFIENDRHAYFNLIKSYLLGLIILFSNHIVYPAGISLPDFGLHFTQFVLPILETGHISTISHIYQFFPTHHILSVVMTLVSGFPAKMTYLFLGSLLISFGIFFVFIHKL